MRKMSSQKWKRSGSSIIWDAELLTPLIQKGYYISLREALSWLDGWLVKTPGNSDTVLISGLQPCIELLDKEDAFTFLRQTILTFLQTAQDKWNDCGIVFAMHSQENRFRVDEANNLVYFKTDIGEIPLTFGMWNGAAKDDQAVSQIYRTDSSHKEIICGYHCIRIS